ncbi:MAG: dihydroneopterin aldolase [Gammaproteobacteria bacterium]
MDIIYLTDLRVDAVIGVNDWERCAKQTLILDIEMGADVNRAAASDDIRDTIDYKAVAHRLADFVGNSRFELLETLAERVAELIINEFHVKWCRLRLNKKGAVRHARDVGVMIERGTRS